MIHRLFASFASAVKGYQLDQKHEGYRNIGEAILKAQGKIRKKLHSKESKDVKNKKIK